jgi:hypothetical protein
MSKLDKIKDILAIGNAVAKPFLPGAAGSVLDAVTQVLGGHHQEPSKPSAEAIQQLAAVNDAQNKAILLMTDHIREQDARIERLEMKMVGSGRVG